MEVECNKVRIPDSLEEMVRALKEGYLTNKRLLHRLEHLLQMSKLPRGVSNFATVVREFFDDVMKSVLDMMGMVTELIKEYANLIQVHYGMQMGDELRRVQDIFLLLEPLKYQPYIGMMVRDSCKLAMAATSGRRTISSDYAAALIRNNLYLAKVTMRVYVREARRAKRKLRRVIESMENNWQSMISSFLMDTCRVAYPRIRWNNGRLWLDGETATVLIRDRLQTAVDLLKILVADIRRAHSNLSQSIRSVCRLPQMLS